MKSKSHFKHSYCSKTFFPPDDIRYCVYSPYIWDQFIDHLSPKSKILDLGCGGGTVLHCLHSLGFNHLHGLDFISAIPSGFVPNLKFFSANVTDTGLPDKSFDAIVSTMVIEHVDDRQMVNEIHRLLRPGGYALITTVLRKSPPWYFYKNPQGERVIEPTHLREYSSTDQFTCLFDNKFKILITKTPHLVYPLIDPLFFTLNRLIKSNYLHNLPTTNPLFKSLRLLRWSLPGYYSLEVLIQKI